MCIVLTLENIQSLITLTTRTLKKAQDSDYKKILLENKDKFEKIIKIKEQTLNPEVDSKDKIVGLFTYDIRVFSGFDVK